MKKKIYSLLFLILLVFLPVVVKAESTTGKMYVDIQIETDGSLFVREITVLNGEYNGNYRTIDFKNINAPHFTGSPTDFGGSDIYNGSNISDIKVYDIDDKNNIDFSSFAKKSHEFTRVNSAANGEYGVYTLTTTSSGVELKIFNPDRYRSAFYIEYRIADAVVVHKDVAELAWNILGDEYQENIDDFKVQVHLPTADSSMRVWGHGPLNGNIERTSDDTVTMTYDFLGAYNAVDVRLMFDKTITPNAIKQTNVAARNYILEYEKQQAEEANRQREAIQLENNIVKIATGLWYVVLLTIIVIVYLKYDKERKVNFDMQYYREIPGAYGPELVEYLLKKNITELGFSASLLQIIVKKGLKVEEIPSSNPKKKVYKFVKTDNGQNLTAAENILLKLLIDDIGNGREVELDEIKKYGKNITNATNFMEKYQDWCLEAKISGEKMNFFQQNNLPKLIGILFSLLGFGLFILNMSFETNFILAYIIPIVSILGIIYFATFKKRTEEGALEYQKWMAFKRFLLDFGRMDEKTLPEVYMWEKYLVYATVLGCADQLEKQMKIKIKNMNTVNDAYMMNDYYLIHFMMYNDISSTLSKTMHTAVASSRSSIAASRSSSSSGFGGGMSTGGGSFGGGSGGGRF